MTEQSSHRQILRSSSIIGGASIINVIIGLFRIKIVAVLLGPAGIGLIGILQNLMSTASIVAALGFGTAGTRQIAEAAGRKDPLSIDTARQALFWGTLCLALLGGSVIWLLRNVLAGQVLGQPDMAASIGWLALGVTLTVISGSQGALLSGMRRITDIAKVQIYSSMLSTLLGISAIGIFGKAGLLLFIIASPLSGVIVGYLYVAKLPTIQTPGTKPSVLVKQCRTMAKLGAAFMMASLAGMLGQLIVRTLIQRELGSADLGYFQAAWLISMTYLGFVLGAMGADFYPRLSAEIHDHTKANRLVNEQTEVAVLLAGPVLLGMLALAPWIIQLLYSDAFTPAVTILHWQILGDVLKIISWPLAFIILAGGHGRVFLAVETAGMVVFSGATWLLLPWLAIKSTGISFFLMYLTYLPLTYLLARHYTSFQWSSVVIRDTITLILAATFVAACGQWSDWLGLIVGLPTALIFSLITLTRLAKMSGPQGLAQKTANRAMVFFKIKAK